MRGKIIVAARCELQAVKAYLYGILPNFQYFVFFLTFLSYKGRYKVLA